MTYLQQDLKLARSRIAILRDPRLRDLEELFGSARKPFGQLRPLLADARPSEVIIYFAGHAMPVDQGKDAILLPADANPAYPIKDGYRLSAIYYALHALGVPRLRVYLDAAFNSRLGARPAPNEPPPELVINFPAIGPAGRLVPRNWVTITAGFGNEPVYVSPNQTVSAFALALLAGLRGQADATVSGNGDGAVTSGELTIYLRRQVAAVVKSATGGQQRPALAGSGNEVLAVVTGAGVAAPSVTPATPLAPPPPAREPEKKATPAKPVKPAKPSFDCSTARADAEQAICANPDVAALDNQMVKHYYAKKRTLKGRQRDALTQRQKRWLRQRNACGPNVSCLIGVYQKRIQQLQ